MPRSLEGAVTSNDEAARRPLRTVAEQIAFCLAHATG
jgi:hypothetical protein